jgi:hypothetical protein
MCILHILVGTAHREVANGGIIIPVGRKLLFLADDHADSSLSHGSGSEIGSFLGWAMAIIYMGGRLPQIFLNMQRGHAEASLSPSSSINIIHSSFTEGYIFILMFLFSFICIIWKTLINRQFAPKRNHHLTTLYMSMCHKDLQLGGKRPSKLN